MVNFCKGVEDWKTWGKVREIFGKTRLNKGSTVTALIVFFFLASECSGFRSGFDVVTVDRYNRDIPRGAFA